MRLLGGIRSLASGSAFRRQYIITQTRSADEGLAIKTVSPATHLVAGEVLHYSAPPARSLEFVRANLRGISAAVVCIREDLCKLFMG